MIKRFDFFSFFFTQLCKTDLVRYVHRKLIFYRHIYVTPDSERVEWKNFDLALNERPVSSDY